MNTPETTTTPQTPTVGSPTAAPSAPVSPYVPGSRGRILNLPPAQGKYRITLAKKLKIPKDKVEFVKERLINELGCWLNGRTLGAMMKVDSFKFVEELKATAQLCREIMENKDPHKFSPEQKLAAGQLLNYTTKTFKELSEHLMELAEKTDENKGAARRQLNLPPQTNMQLNVNVQNTPSPAPAPASSGNDTPPVTPPA